MITVFVVDDSAFYRVNLSQTINSDRDLKVIGTASDGNTALDKIKQSKPDVITLDFELAGISGTDLIKKIKELDDIPIIVVSSFKSISSEEEITGLENKIFDFVGKPDEYSTDKLNVLKNELISKIKAAHSFGDKKIAPLKKKEKLEGIRFHSTTKKILLVASSTGGPQTLERFIPEIPANIPCPILVVQHMPPVFTKSLADRLDKICNVRVVEAKDNTEIKEGVVYIAPGDFHMLLETHKEGVFTKEILRLSQEEREEGVRPCANKLFASVAPVYGENTVAVVLTGMGYDGTRGAREIKKYRGSVIAQSQKTCVIYGMPKSIVDNGLADEVVDIDKMAVAVVQLLGV
jgi:two-component system chemotaxis response regulator CheB